MPPARFVALLVIAAMLLGGVTVTLIWALPPDMRIWVIPILLVAALAVRAFGWRR